MLAMLGFSRALLYILALPSAAVVRATAVRSAVVLDRRERMIVKLAVTVGREAMKGARVAAGDTNANRLAAENEL